MRGSSQSYQLLIEKLDQFIRKYYVNKILKGGLYLIGFVLGLFLLFNLLEYFFYFSPTGRKILFYSFIFVSAGSFITWVGIPLLGYLKLGQQISHEQAATIIGNHFVGVKDKLLNILQLRSSKSDYSSTELIEASIAQKSDEIRFVSFKSAIDLAKNKKYLRYALPPLLLLLAFLVAAPNMITDPTNRILKNNEHFERAAPFSFILQNNSLEVPQNADVEIVVKAEGNSVPEEVLINIGGFPYSMKADGNGVYKYRINNVQEDLSFYFNSGTVKSANYQLDMLERPVVQDFIVRLDYPAYTGKKDETIDNVGDLVVPIGTRVQWALNTQFVDSLYFKFNNNTLSASSKSKNNFLFTRRVLKDSRYKILMQNNILSSPDSVQYLINVIPDQYPTIEQRQFVDSLNENVFYFAGSAADDYGLSKLLFHYTIAREDGQEVKADATPIPVKRDVSSPFQHIWDIETLDLNPGDELRFYFEIWDNDGVSGPKASRTGVQRIFMPSLEELEEQQADNSEAIKEKLSKNREESKNVQDELKRLREKLLQEKELDWQSRKDLEKLIDRQKELQKELNKAKEQFKENLKNQEQLKQNMPEELLQKQEKLEELFEQSKNQEMEDLLEQIQDLLQELNKDQAIEMMEQVQQNQQQNEQTMERLLELYKQLEVEAEVFRQIEKLEELADKQEALSEESEKEETKSDSLNMEQEKLNEAFDKVQEKMEEMLKKNEDLQKPKDLGDDIPEEMEDIDQDMQESSDQLKQEQKDKASGSQKKAAEKMRKMANKMEMQMASSDMEQAQEDIRALRQLLENLITMSFDQEDLVNDFNAVRINTPEYVSLIQDQNKLKGDFRLIEDSLNALAKRVLQIEAFVGQKVKEVNDNLEQSLVELQERKKTQATDFQRRTMKNVNDLALMLSEAMNQMQQDMANKMPGNQMCNKPGGTGSSGKGKEKGPIDKISEGQEQLGEQLGKMQQKAKEGKENSSKDFAEAAARQAALRKMLKDMQQEKQERGSGDPLLQEIMDEMNKIETDLVNKRLTNEMMQRQQEIKTRLLEAEKAEREREWDSKRKSTTAKEQERKFPPALDEYIKQRETEIDFYKPISPELLPFYKMLVDSYYNELKKGS